METGDCDYLSLLLYLYSSKYPIQLKDIHKSKDVTQMQTLTVHTAIDRKCYSAAVPRTVNELAAPPLYLVASSAVLYETINKLAPNIISSIHHCATPQSNPKTHSLLLPVYGYTYRSIILGTAQSDSLPYL